MSRLSVLILVAFPMIFVTNSAVAAPPAQDNLTRIVHGTFTDETGKALRFSIPEGRGLKLTHKGSNLTYRLVAERLGTDRVVLAVVDPATDALVERFALQLNSKARLGRAVPFSLALTSMTVRDIGTPCLRKSEETSMPGERPNLDCCIECGSWLVCCEPSAGWCCELECLEPGGDWCFTCTHE